MESADITLKRTASATAVAARYLAKSNAERALIIGTGNQGMIQLEGLTRVCSLKHASVWDRDPKKSHEYAVKMAARLNREVEPVTNLEAAALASDIIVTCTPAKRWLLGASMVSPGTLVAGIGADSPDKQELEPALLANHSVVTDLTSQCAQVGDLHHALAAGLMQETEVRGELGQIIIGKVPRRRDDQEIIIFDATGTALQDVAAAALVYENALAEGKGARFGFWD
jgi:ornithine cyclodeaminase/alanine dehydrogenase-like protein (mu-crystallin family)